MNRRQVLVGSSGATIGLSVASGAIAAPSGTITPFKTDVRDFGGIGDGIADDAPSIQAALDHVGQNGGGTVLLPPPQNHYRISQGLKLPSYVTLEGASPAQYPYNASNRGACALVADFADTRQWIIEPKTQVNGRYVAYDQLIGGSLPDGTTYNCGVRNLLLTSRGNIPFGGIRMHGCPGASVEGVSIERVGCGLLVNYSFGGHYQLLVSSLYYGIAAWDDANANSFQVYCSHRTPWPKIVPAEYRLPFMTQMQRHFADTLLLSTDEHASRPYGILCGSIRSTSVGSIFDATVEGFPGGIFLYNAYATDFRQCYIEAGSDAMTCAIAASRSRFGIQALHAYLSNTGSIFDFGIDVLGKIFASGILSAASFGKPPKDDGSSLLILEGFEPGMPGAPIQRGIRYASKEPEWIPLRLQSGWRAANSDLPAVRFDYWSHQIQLKGTVSGGDKGICFNLPQLCRPPNLRRYMVPGGQVTIASDGNARIESNAPLVSLDGIAFTRW